MFDEEENFEGEREIAGLLLNLKRVDAPGDFDTHVRARIARGAKVPAKSRVRSLIRIGAPLAAAIVIALGGYFVLTSLYTRQNDVPAVAETRPEPQNPLVEPPRSNIETTQTSNRTTVKPSDEFGGENSKPAQANDAPKQSGPTSPDSNSSKGNTRGGSVEFAARERNTILPRGLNPNSKVPANSKGVDPNARIHVTSLFEFIGVKATWAGDGWRIDSVSANNIADRSGIKTGDIVEAINGQTVDKKTTFPAKFDGKNVRVRRDGASVQIDFKP